MVSMQNQAISAASGYVSSLSPTKDTSILTSGSQAATTPCSPQQSPASSWPITLAGCECSVTWISSLQALCLPTHQLCVQLALTRVAHCTCWLAALCQGFVGGTHELAQVLDAIERSMKQEHVLASIFHLTVGTQLVTALEVNARAVRCFWG